MIKRYSGCFPYCRCCTPYPCQVNGVCFCIGGGLQVDFFWSRRSLRLFRSASKAKTYANAHGYTQFEVVSTYVTSEFQNRSEAMGISSKIAKSKQFILPFQILFIANGQSRYFVPNVIPILGRHFRQENMCSAKNHLLPMRQRQN
jgi:hypothetical protein